MQDKYLGTTASELDHYFANYVGMAKDWLMEGEKERAQAQKVPFVDGLERVIDKNLPEFKGITNDTLRMIVKLAQSGDWSEIETIKSFYRWYYQIRGKIFDKQILFPQK